MKILVIGDNCIDTFRYGKVERLAPEAPVPVIVPEREVSTPGMAGNVVRNLEALGAEVNFITNKVEIKKIRYVCSKYNHLLLRVDENDKCEPLPEATIGDVDWSNYDAVVISDYCKGFLIEDDIKYISEKHPLTFLDTKKKLNGFADKINFIKINESEYNKSKSTITSELENKLIITLGSNGAKYNNKIYNVKQVDVRDTSGAGDTFLAGLVYDYILNNNIDHAIEFANKCASQVVQKKGTAKININEL
jgi:D-beta-D-heptose 7-phosphate kinase/D-beta-D-heptose 1-phosphate adenosyltransferase